jgi:hypothetical protein
MNAPVLCAVCRQPIQHVNDGWVEWLVAKSGDGYAAVPGALRLVHRLPEGCTYRETGHAQGQHVQEHNADAFSAVHRQVHLYQILPELEVEALLARVRRLNGFAYAKKKRRAMDEATSPMPLDPPCSVPEAIELAKKAYREARAS